MRTYLFLPLILIIFSCNKFKNFSDDTSGNATIRGRLFIYNPLTGIYDTLPQGKKTILLSDPTKNSVDNYILKTITDSTGYFVFTNLISSKKYQIYYEEKIGNLIFIADSSLLPGNDSLYFLAEPSINKNTGIEYFITDTTKQHGPIPGISICVFTSSQLVNDSCKGSAYQLVTDVYGRAYQFNLQPGTYYSVIKSNYYRLLSKKIDTIVINEGVIKKTISLP